MPLGLSEHASAAAVVIAFAVWLRAQRGPRHCASKTAERGD
jgi:hypothetical protein